MKQLIRHILREHTREIGETMKITTPEFIQKAKEVHGDKYDYSKTDYKGKQKKVKIICPIHGEFETQANYHLQGRECRKCASQKRNSKHSLGTEKFINRAIEVHGKKYNYDDVDYSNSTNKVQINCPIHGPFFQSPEKHMRGDGCRKCAGRDKTTEDFILQAKEVHGNKYDYSNVDYENATKKIKIICPIHGEFEQSPNNHLTGYGCLECGGSIKKTFDDFITGAHKSHGDKYDYSKVNFIDYRNIPVEIICPIHGKFSQIPKNHVGGQGCPKCANKNITTDEFIIRSKKIHGNKYDYSNSIYNGATNPIEIICPKHGPFSQSAGAHMTMGQGCPSCNESKGEKLVNDILVKYKVKNIRQKRFIDCISTNKGKRCLPLPFDFYLPKYNMCVEYDGEQHFKPVSSFGGEEAFKTQKIRDKLKNQYCKKNGIKLIRIPYTMKMEDIEPYILKELGIN